MRWARAAGVLLLLVIGGGSVPLLIKDWHLWASHDVGPIIAGTLLLYLDLAIIGLAAYITSQLWGEIY